MTRPPGVVTVFTTTTCPHCRAAKTLLGTKDVNLVVWEVDLYPPEVREEMSKLAGGAKSVPQIFLNEKHLPGGNSNLQELEKDGKLDALLAESLAEPPGPGVPTVTAEKVKKVEPSVEAMGLGGLARSDELEKKLRAIVDGLKTSGIKGKFTGNEVLTWLKGHDFDPTLTDALIKYGIIKATGGTTGSMSASGKYIFASDEHPGVLNMQFDASQVTGLKAKRPAEEVVLLLRKQILGLYQTFLSKDGSSVNYAGIKRSKEFEAYMDTAAELQLITVEDLEKFTEHARRAFFINLYNALAIHGFAQFGHASSSVGRLRFFNSTAYRMGGLDWSLNLIEHGILRSNKPSPAGFFPLFRGWMFSSLPLIEPHDKRIKCVMKELDPRIHFALNCGAKSCPPIKLFSGDSLDSELLLAAQAFCEDDSNVHVDKTTKSVRLSMILKWYGRDFGKDDVAVCNRLLQYLNADKRAALEDVLKDGKPNLSYSPYDWGENTKSDA